MFLAFRRRVDGSALLPAHQVVIGDWESRHFGDSVFLAPKDDIIQKMYHKMGSEFLGTNVRYDIDPPDPNVKYNPSFNRDQIVRRIRYFMSQRDESEKTDVSFYNEGSTDNFRVRACKTLTMKKTFTPPLGVLADGGDERIRKTKPVQVNAGFEFGATCESPTLWVVKGSSDVDPHNDIAVALCRVLLKTFGPNDVLLLASLIATGEESLECYYDSEMKSELPSAPDPKVEPKKKKKKNVKVELQASSYLAKVLGAIFPKNLRVAGQKTIPPEDDMRNAMSSWGLDSNDPPPDFSAPCQPNPASFKKHNSRCKQAHAIKLREKQNLRDERTQIKFFLAQDARCQQPPQPALQEFAQLISDLTKVFNREASKACYIFWKDTDEDLMAFNRDQKYIFLNLAHYHRFFHITGVEKKDAVTEWFLIMAHEIAHNVTLDHDEYHGSLSSRLVAAYLPALHEHFKCFAPPQST